MQASVFPPNSEVQSSIARSSLRYAEEACSKKVTLCVATGVILRSLFLSVFKRFQEELTVGLLVLRKYV